MKLKETIKSTAGMLGFMIGTLIVVLLLMFASEFAINNMVSLAVENPILAAWLAIPVAIIAVAWFIAVIFGLF